MTTTRGLALTTTVGVVDRVHGHTAHGRANTFPAHPTSLAPVDVGLLRVAHLADRGAAPDIDHPSLTRGHPQGGQLALASQQLDPRTSGAGQFGAAARAQFHGVDGGADRDIAQRQIIAGTDVSAFSGLHPGPLGQTLRSENVSLLAVGVVQQRDPSSAVRVVLDLGDSGRDSVLVIAAEVHQAVGLLVTAANVASGDPALVVAATGLRLRRQQGLLRGGAGHLDEVSDARPATTRSGRLVFADTHQSLPFLSRPGRTGRFAGPRPRLRSPAWCRGGGRSRTGCAASCQPD